MTILNNLIPKIYLRVVTTSLFINSDANVIRNQLSVKQNKSILILTASFHLLNHIRDNR